MPKHFLALIKSPTLTGAKVDFERFLVSKTKRAAYSHAHTIGTKKIYNFEMIF